MKTIVKTLATLMLLCVPLALTGCESSRGTGTLAGAGAGALIGQAVGGNTRSTLIGAGVGAAGGYIIGNEVDRSQAAARERARQAAPPAELQPLMGTTWTLTSMTPESARNFASMIIDFRSNGILFTTRTDNNGQVRTDEEYYRIVNNTLIVNDRDYIINGPFILQGRNLTFVVSDVTSRWSRLGG